MAGSSDLSGGTGEKLTNATIVVAGSAALLASILSIVYVSERLRSFTLEANILFNRSVWLQTYVVKAT